MIDERKVGEMLQRRADAVPATPVDAPKAVRRARRRLVLNGVVAAVAAAALVAVTFVGVDAIRSAPVPADHRSVTPTPPAKVFPVQDRDPSLLAHGHHEDYGIAWRDPHDAAVGWVDVERVFTDEEGDGYWTIELAKEPPLAVDIKGNLVIAYGLVLDTTGDGVADYLIGIDNDAPERGDFHVWVTDLATGMTDEQIGPRYGYPIEFRHPDEWRPGDTNNPRTLTLTFLDDSSTPGLDPDTVCFYAWTSATRDGEVYARDFAPDRGWMTMTRT